jgi:hypothetical protein
MKRYQKSKLFSKIGCIHIQQQQELPSNYRQIFQEHTGIDLEVIRLEDALGKEGASLGDVRNLLGMFQKSANTIDILSIFRDRLILDFACKNDYQFILKGLNG